MEGADFTVSPSLRPPEHPAQPLQRQAQGWVESRVGLLWVHVVTLLPDLSTKRPGMMQKTR